MMNWIKYFGWGAGAWLILTAFTTPTTATPPKFEVGQPFPNLVLPALEDGKPRSLADFRGHKLILHVFASWWAGCRIHVPGWHNATKDYQKDGRIQMLGVIQEQHPDRAQLFMQWKHMDWLILVDALNELEVEVVPITLFIDEYGIIRKKNPSRRNALREVEDFVGQKFTPPEMPVAANTTRPDIDRLRPDEGSSSAEAWRTYGRSLVNWGDDGLDDAVSAFETAVRLDDDHGLTHFQLGVSYRRRLESAHRKVGDFQSAVDQWGQALAINPNQYIWRRRIQQFGPRLMKPYPFYDWVDEARAEIVERGETPVELAVEPSGAEVAQPSRSFGDDESPGKNPDPEGRIHRDERGFILVESTVVPAWVKPGGIVRVHLRFRPNASLKAHWNNEAEPMSLWITPPEGCVASPREQNLANPDSAVSLEVRTLEFEVRVPLDVSTDVLKLPAYALYNVCEDVEGKCLYRRQDIPIRIRMKR